MNTGYSNKEAFSWSLGQLFEHVGLWFSLVAIRLFPMVGLFVAVAIPLLLPIQAITAWSPFAGRWSPQVAGSLMSWVGFSGLFLAVILLLAFSFLFASAWVAGTAVALDVYDNGRSSLRNFWAYFFAYGWRAWLLFILVALFVLLGLVFFVIPGLWIALRLILAPFALVDLRISPWQACKISWRMTEAIMGRLWVTALVLLFLGLALWSTVWLFLFVYPLVLLVKTYIYRFFGFYQKTIAEVDLVAVF